MKKFFLPAVLMFVFSITAAAAESPAIVTPQWVNENLKQPDLVILQVNYLRLDFEKEHIEGARFLWPSWLAADSPEGNFNPPDVKEATKILQQLGVNKDSRVVLCFTKSDLSVTARMFVTLEYLGLAGKVSLLNGGLEAWKKAGFPVVSGPVTAKKGNFVASVNPVLVDKDYVLSVLQSEKSAVIDARVKRFYDGDPTGYPRDGHIAGAKNIQFTDLYDSTSTIKPDHQLLNYFETVVPDKKKELVNYCFIGQTASVVYIAGKHLGYKVKIYDGSMQEWSRLENLPMEKSKKD